MKFGSFSTLSPLPGTTLPYMPSSSGGISQQQPASTAQQPDNTVFNRVSLPAVSPSDEYYPMPTSQATVNPFQTSTLPVMPAPGVIPQQHMPVDTYVPLGRTGTSQSLPSANHPLYSPQPGMQRKAYPAASTPVPHLSETQQTPSPNGFPEQMPESPAQHHPSSSEKPVSETAVTAAETGSSLALPPPAQQKPENSASQPASEASENPISPKPDEASTPSGETTESAETPETPSSESIPSSKPDSSPDPDSSALNTEELPKESPPDKPEEKPETSPTSSDTPSSEGSASNAPVEASPKADSTEPKPTAAKKTTAKAPEEEASLTSLKNEIGSGLTTSRETPETVSTLPTISEIQQGASSTIRNISGNLGNAFQTGISSGLGVAKEASKTALIGGAIGGGTALMLAIWKKPAWLWGATITGTLVGAAIGLAARFTQYTVKGAMNLKEKLMPAPSPDSATI